MGREEKKEKKRTGGRNSVWQTWLDCEDGESHVVIHSTLVRLDHFNTAKEPIKGFASPIRRLTFSRREHPPPIFDTFGAQCLKIHFWNIVSTRILAFFIVRGLRTGSRWKVPAWRDCHRQKLTSHNRKRLTKGTKVLLLLLAQESWCKRSASPTSSYGLAAFETRLSHTRTLHTTDQQQCKQPSLLNDVFIAIRNRNISRKPIPGSYLSFSRGDAFLYLSKAHNEFWRQVGGWVEHCAWHLTFL